MKKLSAFEVKWPRAATTKKRFEKYGQIEVLIKI